ncbi:MAG: dihydroneopterin aldolase [Solirubrobacteraceae bacterium]
MDDPDDVRDDEPASGGEPDDGAADTEELEESFDDEDDADQEEAYEDGEDSHPEPEVTIEISGLALYTHFGVSAAEREIGQRLIVDLRLEVGDCDATVTDRIEDTVDYGEVCEAIYLISQQREYRTLERFCAAVADRLLERYELGAIWVKASKPEPPIPLAIGEVSVEVWREA